MLLGPKHLWKERKRSRKDRRRWYSEPQQWTWLTSWELWSLHGLTQMSDSGLPQPDIYPTPISQSIEMGSSRKNMTFGWGGSLCSQLSPWRGRQYSQQLGDKPLNRGSGCYVLHLTHTLQVMFISFPLLTLSLKTSFTNRYSGVQKDAIMINILSILVLCS